MSSPEWWSGCAQKTPRTLLAHREAPALGRASRTPPGTSGSCSRTMTSRRCCSRWGSWRGCRGWRRRSPDRTSWRSWLTTQLPSRPSSGQNHPSWPQICQNDPNLTPKLPRFYCTPELPVPFQLGPQPDNTITHQVMIFTIHLISKNLATFLTFVFFLVLLFVTVKSYSTQK